MKTYTIEEASQALQLAKNTIRAYLYRDKTIKYRKKGNQTVIPEEEITKYKEFIKNKVNRKRADCLYNNEFKNIDTEEKAYFLGLLYADGCLYAHKNKEKSVNFGVRINLHKDDSYILYKFKELFPFFSLSILHKQNQVLLRYTGRHIYKDFFFNGLRPRKSYENKEELGLPILNKELMPHFIRGFFDGDGSISIAKRRPNLRRVDLTSVSKRLITEIYEYFSKIKIPPSQFREKKPKDLNGKARQHTYVIEWITIDKVIQLRDYLYKDSTIFLKRKKDKFDSLKKINKLNKGIKCSYCSLDDKIMAMGKRQMKEKVMLRFICLHCNKRFSKDKESVPNKKSDELLEPPKALSTGNSNNLKDVTMDNQQPS